MIRIAVCDDDMKTCNLLEEYIAKICDDMDVKLELHIYDNSTELCECVQKGQKYEVLFLDIEMPNRNGIEVGSYLRKNCGDDSIQIVYISGSESYAMKLFETHPVNFLIKPLAYEAVEETLKNSLELMNTMAQKFVYRKKQDVYFVDYRDIMYFKSNNRKVQIVIPDQTLDFYGKLEEIYQTLPESRFLYIHKSFIVNIAFIKTFEYSSLSLLNGEVLPISQSRRKAIRIAQESFTLGGNK
ncbi:MAG: LytTR family DNA-binding domain-containing protein [Butyribacter sp.]|nr:LytTR family DNA-binding domain-containing protein [bacterium]MDY3854101.1 LytTR family DNA-binding domain-containing protein [Butyribacter sp.]